MQSNSGCTYKQAAAIPFRFEASRLRLLLISNRNQKRWVFPKGIIENGSSPADAAATEAYEEAGIRGFLHPDSIGQYRYSKWGGTYVVQVFPLEVTQILEQWPESPIRQRRWVNLEEAGRLADSRMPREILQEFSARIETTKYLPGSAGKSNLVK